MTTIDETIEGRARSGTGTFPTPVRPDDDRFVGLAAAVGSVAAEHAAGHDRAATFVSEAYDAMRATGYLALPVPEELGGSGATLRQLAHAQAELGRHDGATALAVTMHLYATAMQAFRHRAGAPDAEGVLRRVAEEGMVIATSGGSDWIWPTTTAAEEDGSLRVSGRKAFCSQAPEADVITTSAVVGEPGDGAEVVHFSLPLASDGVHLVPTWDTMGMRGTASHDLVLEDVIVPTEKITGRRPYGEMGLPLLLATTFFAPLGGACYLGIASGARDVAVATARAGRRGPTCPTSSARWGSWTPSCAGRGGS